VEWTGENFNVVVTETDESEVARSRLDDDGGWRGKGFSVVLQQRHLSKRSGG
jgi:hypothetical protein